MKVVYAPRHPVAFGLGYLVILVFAGVLYACIYALGLVVGAIYLLAKQVRRRPPS